MNPATRRALTLVLDNFRNSEILDDDGIWEARLANAARRAGDVVVKVGKPVSRQKKRAANVANQGGMF